MTDRAPLGSTTCGALALTRRLRSPMLPSMIDSDSLVVIATHLRPEEAGMLRGVLESAGIYAVLRDEMLSSVNPFLQPAIGGVKLAVRVVDAERAQEVIRSTGVLPGPGPDEPVDISEEEWARPAAEESARGASPASDRATWRRRVVIAALVLLAWLVGFYW